MPNSTWVVVGASVAGSSHLRDGRGCEDAQATQELPHGYIALAVGDGAGSAARGAIGAETASTAAIAALVASMRADVPATADDWRTVLLHAFDEALSAIRQLAGEGRDGGRIADYATTLLVAIAGPEWTAAAQVGDGLVAVERAGAITRLTHADRGEYINETTFLTSPSRDEALSVSVDDSPVDSVVLMTDGLEPLATNLTSGEVHRPFFWPLLEFARSTDANAGDLAAFLDSPRVRSRTDDDKTLVIAVRSHSVGGAK